MTGKDSFKKSYSLEQVLTDQHVQNIFRQTVGSDDCELMCSEVKPATEGLSGFLGDHIRVVLHVKVKDTVDKVHLFVKRIPADNKPKAEFIDVNNFFKRERLMFELLDDIKGFEGPHPWSVKAYVYTDSLLVMPDLTNAGYKVHPFQKTWDLQHVLQTTASVARFHAAFANYDTRKTLNATFPYDFYQDYEHVLQEPTFKDSPWVRACAKLSVNLLSTFSNKYNSATMPGLESKLTTLFIKACLSLKVSKDTLNVVIHRDLWNNNVLFKYDGDCPTNAVLIDYQCMRFGPPTFDITSLLYLTTTRLFREERENDVYKYYFKIFTDSLEDATRKKLVSLGYDESEFLRWCEKSRMFAVFSAVGIFPYVLMEPKLAQKVFDDPDTYMELCEEDRSVPVLEHATQCAVYRERQLEVSEEFVERYVL